MATHKVEFPTHKRPSTNVSTGALLGIAAVLTAVIYGALWPMGDEGAAGFARDLFIGRTHKTDSGGESRYYADRLIFCGLITYVFCLSVTNAILKSKRVKQERGYLNENVLTDELDFHNDEQIRGVYDRVKNHPSLTESIGLTRVARVLAVWVNSGDPEHTGDLAKEEAEQDAYASDSTYRLNRLFIWALPVLGFIGTVYGVSLAVSNFAGFLAGDVTPEAIKYQVGLITTGLGVAFYTTLLGLIAATIAAFSSLLMERSEEGMLDATNELVQDRIILHLPTSAEQAKDEFPLEKMVQAIKEGMEGIQSNLKFPVDELAQAIDAGFRRLPNPDRYEEVFTRAISKAGDIINQKYEEFQTNYERRVGELGSQLGGKLELVAGNFNAGSQRLAEDFRKTQEKNLEVFSRNEQKLAEKFDELTEQISTLGKEQNEAFGEAHEKYVEAVEELDKKTIARWEKSVGEFNELATKLAEQFSKSVASMENATMRYSDQIRSSVDQLAKQLERVSQLGIEIDKVLKTTVAMETTLRQVGSSDEFRQTLANLRNHLTTSDELLKQLSRPRKVVFQEARSDESL